MVYAYDQWAQLPVRDLYNTQVMAMAIQSAKDMYEKAENELKDFRKEYGDFYSPNRYDMDWYRDNFNPATVVNSIYDRGGDPLRNSQDRAELGRWIYSRPYAELNARKLRSANLQKYNENKASLMSKGLFDPDQEAFDLMRRYGRSDDPNNWNFDEMGLSSFDRLSPVQAVSLKNATSDWFDKRTAYSLSPDQVKQAGFDYDPRYDYTGWLESDLQRTAGENVPGWNGSFAADYFRDKARRQLISAGIENPTQKQINDHLQNMVAEANREYIINPTKSENKFALEQQKFANDVALENLKNKHALERIGAQKAYSKQGQEKPATSYGQTLLLRGLQNFSGSTDPGVKGLEIAQTFGDRTRPLSWNQRVDAFRNKYMMAGADSPQMFVSRFSMIPSRVKDVTAIDAVNLDLAYDKQNLYSLEEVTSGTLGFPGNVVRTNRNSIDGLTSNKDNVPMRTTGNVYTAPFKDGTYKQFSEVDLDGHKYFYKIFESEPVPVESNSMDFGAQWQPTSPDKPFAPYGYSRIPSQATTNAWGAQDNALNKAAGLASDQIHAAGGNYIDLQEAYDKGIMY